ncbi:MAG: hypothetical protein KJ573_06090 [Proteobacteria bacterium]|nr:hypothetical protein [Pseudomonadota bacterium]MBU1903147.1 hypothetical protein [Pseudomonadota bacterium]
MMKKTIFQFILLLFLASLCLGGFFLGKHFVQLPFRAANDALHKDGAPFTLDFLIPGGTYLDEKATIGDVIKIKLKKTSSPFEKSLRAVSDLIPPRYRYLGDILLFFFWSLCFLTFFRVFTFMGYGRALRTSLFLGGVTYYFMPDFSPGSGDDILFVAFPLLIILVRFYLVRRSREKKKMFRKE